MQMNHTNISYNYTHKFKSSAGISLVYHIITKAILFYKNLSFWYRGEEYEKRLKDDDAYLRIALPLQLSAQCSAAAHMVTE